MPDDSAIQPLQPPTDLMAYKPEQIAGNFKMAAHIAALAEEAAKHMPKWMGRCPRIPGNNASAEVTRYGTLLVVNEITMADLPEFVQWLAEMSDLPVAVVMKCGHPATAFRREDGRGEEGTGGMYAEPSTNVKGHCAICAQIEQAQAMQRRGKEALDVVDDEVAEARGAMADTVRKLREQLEDAKARVAKWEGALADKKVRKAVEKYLKKKGETPSADDAD